VAKQNFASLSQGIQHFPLLQMMLQNIQHQRDQLQMNSQLYNHGYGCSETTFMQTLSKAPTECAPPGER
jgi:hypothetical protein